MFGINVSGRGFRTPQYSLVVQYSVVQCNAMQFVLQDSHVQTVPYNGAADFAAPRNAMQLHWGYIAQSGAVDSVAHSTVGIQ